MSEDAATPSASRGSIMSVAEIIDSAFGLPTKNTVDHKLIQAVLYILARQLNVLGRQVEIVTEQIPEGSSSSLSITEVRIQTKKKALVSKISGVGVGGIKEKRATASDMGKLKSRVRGKVKPDREKMDETQESLKKIEEGHGVDKDKKAQEAELSDTATLRRKKSRERKITIGTAEIQGFESEEDDEIQTQKRAKSKRHGSSSSEKSERSSDEITEEISFGKKTIAKTDKTTSDKSSSDKTALDKSSSDKTKSDLADKSTLDKSSSDKTKSDLADKTTTDKSEYETKNKLSSVRALFEETSEKALTEKSSSDKTTSSKLVSSTGRSILEPSSSADKTFSKQTTSSLDKSATIKTAADITDQEKIVSTYQTSSRISSSAHKISAKEKISTEKITEKTTTSTDKRSRQQTLPRDETSLKQTPSDDRTSLKPSEKRSSQLTSTTKIYHLQVTSEKDVLKTKLSTEKTTLDPSSVPHEGTSTDATSLPDKGTAEKTTLDKAASGRVSSSTDRTLLQPVSSLEKTTDKSKSPSIEKILSQEVRSTDKISSPVTLSSDKTSVKRSSSVEKTLGKPTSSADQLLRATSSEDKTHKKSTFATDEKSSTKGSLLPTDEFSSDKYAYETKRDKRVSPEKNSSKTTPSIDKITTEKGTKSGKKSDASGSGRKGRINLQLLEALEENRETELRVIHQRSDSREERTGSPTPIGSLDSVEAKYEKLLVVERVSSKEARERIAGTRPSDKTPKISLVTQEEFEVLTKTVRQIQQKFRDVGKMELPENMQLMEELRKGASLTDAMGALQLSARLEAAEKMLQQMMSLITELAQKTPGLYLTGKGMEVIYSGPKSGDKSKYTSSAISRKASIAPGVLTPTSKKSIASRRVSVGRSVAGSSSEESINLSSRKPISLDKSSGVEDTSIPTGILSGAPIIIKDRVTHFELDDALQKIYDDITDKIDHAKTKSAQCADKTFRIVTKLEERLNSALSLGDRMGNLEDLIANYSEKVNILDTGLSSQMTNFQEELTQMQHDLETGLDAMAEVLANAGIDTTAVADLNLHFSNLAADIENTAYQQKDLQSTQDALSYDLSNLQIEIETLRHEKSDRDEVADALRDKAGLGELNGLVSIEQFDAVRGDFEKKILSAYDKFNNQEAFWQKIIDDLIRDLNDKADTLQIESLRSDTSRYLTDLNARLNAIMDIVGEPEAISVTRKLHRDEACLSCATPAILKSTTQNVPALPALRPPAIGAEAPRPREGGDYEPCYPGRPIPHPIDPRARICKRWCGGSHTVIPNAVSRAPALTLSTIVRDTTTTVGTDGKVYQTEEMVRKPCKPCNTVARATSLPVSVSNIDLEPEETQVVVEVLLESPPI